MRSNKIWRAVILPFLALAVCAAAAISYIAGQNTCMGVKILSEAEMSRFTAHTQQEISGHILLNGDNAAVDAGTFTVYVSQNIDENTTYKDLKGSLGLSQNGWQMYFAPDAMFADLALAVQQGHPFELYIDTGNGEYSLYYVVFTTLPVVRMHGDLYYTNADSTNVYRGGVTVWESNYAGTGGSMTEKSYTVWQDVDARDMADSAASWKLSLRTEQNNVDMLNIAGLGKDDDWLLNSISGDSTKIREKLTASLWNGMYSFTERDRMAEGEYVEFIANSEYKGVYTISRRIDQKYLDLDIDDILLRDKKARRGSYAQNNYTAVHNYYSEQQLWQIVTPFHTMENCSVIDVNNWIDANIFTNLVYNNGKRNYTEMYYVWQNAQYNPQVSMIPVSEDSVFGIKWNKAKEKYVFDQTISQREVEYRREYTSLKEIYPELDTMIAERYADLRETSLSDGAIFSTVDALQAQLDTSGAYTRTAGDNDVEQLKEYIKARLEYLDLYYNVK